MQSIRYDLRLCVSDTSVLTDLDRGSLLEAVFDLPLVFVVPDLLYERELRSYGGSRLLMRGLQVAELDGEGVARALNFRRMRPSLSLADTFALALATENRWMLLTGDRVLRNLRISERVVCHGLLWLLDQMWDTEVTERRTLYSALKALSAHPRCRLPRPEVNKRLSGWRMHLTDSPDENYA